MAKVKSEYVSIEQKQQEWITKRDNLQASFNAASEAEKPAIQEQLTEAERKVRWYEGRKNSAKFQAKVAASQAAPATEAPAEVPTPAANPATEV